MQITRTRTKYYLLSLLGTLLVAVGVLAVAPTIQAQTTDRDCRAGGGGQICLEKTVSPNPGIVGQPITFTVTQENLSPTSFNPLPTTLEDVLPPGLQVVSVTPPCTLNAPTNTVTCPPRTLPAFGEFTFTITAIPTQCGSFVNTARELAPNTGAELLRVEVPFRVCEEEVLQQGAVPEQEASQRGEASAESTQEGEQESEAGQIDQSFDVS